MKSQQLDGAVAATWILGAGLIGFLGNVTSLAGATIVVGFGLVPPLLLLTLRRRRPVQAIAVSVHQPNP